MATPVDEPARTGRTRKGERTRERILESALELFLKNGYEKTGMRAVAEKAGVSLGNAYYYFDSKEHLIQGFYARTHEEHVAALEPLLAKEKDFKQRLRATITTKLETAEPYHAFSGLLFKTAADPRSPLNPFSPESEPTRSEATALMEQVLAESKARVPDDLRAELPSLLWLYLMAIILFWIHDESPGRARTHRLVDRTVDLVTRLIALASNPLMRPVRKATLRLLEDLRQPQVAPG